MNHETGIAEQGNMSQDLHPVLGPDPDQKLAISSKFPGAKSGPAVKIADIAEHFAPLAGQQIDDIDAFSRTFQQGGLGAEEMNVGIGGDPALFAPTEDFIDFKGDLFGF